MPCRDSGLPRDAQNCTGTTGNVFERRIPSQGLMPDIAATPRRRDSEMTRESSNTSIHPPHFQSRSDMLNHIGGTHSHGGMMDYPRILIAEWNLGKFLDSMVFQSWKVNFRTEVF